jgi:glycosyltransferase involved in cell wall biosynthesis
LPIIRLYPEIDGSRFRFRPLEEKRPLIATNAKARKDVMAVFHLLRARARIGLNDLARFEWVFLDDLSQERAAEILGDALFFLFLSAHEGFGRMPVEAMACGAIPVSYLVGPSHEFLPGGCGFEVGDLQGVAQFIERHALDFRCSPELRRIAGEGRAIAERFSLERQRTEVLRAWEQLLSATRAPRLAASAPAALPVLDLAPPVMETREAS